MFLFLADLSTEQLVAQTLMVIVPSLHQNMCVELKGLVHPKMKILSVFTHPHVVPTP